MAVIEWCEPPTFGRPPVWPERLKPVMQRPGEWAVVWQTDSPAAAYCTARDLRKRRYMDQPAGRWEYRSGRYKGRFAVWARYLGSEAE